MAHARTFRFGIMAGKAKSGATWTELARKAEDLGYSTLCVADHFTDGFAPTPALAAAAAVTTKLRIGSMVYGVDFRHPAALAKEAATMDLLSDGRFELGIGARCGVPPEAALASPNTLVGSVDALVDEIHARRERWDGSYMIVTADAIDAFAPVVARLAG